MSDNFEFLKEVDKELFSAIEDAQKLFRDEYFNQAVVQLRIFAEKMAKKVLGPTNGELTFDDTLNCLKDKIKTEQEKEFIDDLFFIKKQGNKCGHGEDILASDALEAIKRAFEASINYAYSKTKDEKINKLQFDDTLLITGKPLKEMRLVDKYVELATQQKEELLNAKQGEFNSQIDRTQEGFKDESVVKNPKQYKAKKPINPKKEKIKTKIKEAKKNLKQNINNIEKPTKPVKSKQKPKKQTKNKKKQQKQLQKLILFLIFVTISLIFITKMLFFF